MNIRRASLTDASTLAKIIGTANQAVAKKFGLNQENAPRHPSFCTKDWIAADLERGEQYFLYEKAGEAAG